MITECVYSANFSSLARLLMQLPFCAGVSERMSQKMECRMKTAICSTCLILNNRQKFYSTINSFDHYELNRDKGGFFLLKRETGSQMDSSRPIFPSRTYCR